MWRAPFRFNAPSRAARDSCLERCRASNKSHRNFAACMFLTEEHGMLHRLCSKPPRRRATVG